MNLVYWYWILIFSNNLVKILSQDSSEDTVTEGNTGVVIASSEVTHLYVGIIISVWLIFVLILAFCLYELIPNDCSVKSLLSGGKPQLSSHVYTITIIAVNPSPTYEYDTTAIRIDLAGKNNQLIASLLMRPVMKTDGESSDSSKKGSNLSRAAPLIGIYKLTSRQPMNKVCQIIIGHNCKQSNASILVRCVEVSNLNSLQCHTYPLNAYIPHFSTPFSEEYSSADTRVSNLEFVEHSNQFSRNGSLTLIEYASIMLLCFNIIILFAYIFSREDNYNPDVWKMWAKVFPIALLLGSISAIIFIFIATPYRLFKEYYLFSTTASISIIKSSVLLVILATALILAIISIAIGIKSINFRVFVQWFRIVIIACFTFILLVILFTFGLLFIHVIPKKSSDLIHKDSFSIPHESDAKRKYKIVSLECNVIEVKSLHKLTIFGSIWLEFALKQHNGLEKAILCDVIEVFSLPHGSVTTNYAENVTKLFGKNADQSAHYATQALEQKGNPRSVSMYRTNKAKDRDNDTNSGTGNPNANAAKPIPIKTQASNPKIKKNKK